MHYVPEWKNAINTRRASVQSAMIFNDDRDEKMTKQQREYLEALCSFLRGEKLPKLEAIFIRSLECHLNPRADETHCHSLICT